VLVSLEAFPEVVFNHQAASDQEIQGPVYRGFPYPVSGIPQPRLNVLHGKMFH
jgi:hypothetical protein